MHSSVPKRPKRRVVVAVRTLQNRAVPKPAQAPLFEARPAAPMRRPSIFPIGTVPPLGAVPERMFAQVIRPERTGGVASAFAVEEIPVPELGPSDVLVLVMAAGVNYNNVWAARGVPVDTCKLHGKYGEPTDFHIGGSDASGVVYAVGSRVTRWRVGDAVVLHCGQWNTEAPELQAGADPVVHPSFRIWGYETNWGSFAQFTKVQDHQCMPKAPHLTWEEAAAPTLVGATAYRMLHGWAPNVVRRGDPVLVWGGAGGLGCMAIQLAALAGARPVAVVSDDGKAEYCRRLGAVGVINRSGFSHWGIPPHWTEAERFEKWLGEARRFGQKVREVLGTKADPTLIIEHPGESTIPTSMVVCATGGMVVICAGTTGYSATVDLRYLWMRQKRLQGSHFANDAQAYAFNDLVCQGRIDPCLSRTFEFQQLGDAHELMSRNQHPPGNMSVLVSAPRAGLRSLPVAA